MKRVFNYVFYFSFLCFIYFFILAPSVFAEAVCQPIYGGGEVCLVSPDITVNKQVANPQTNKFVEHLNINDTKHGPNSIVNFRITVRNTRTSDINNIEIKDIFPQYLLFDKGPGDFNSNTKTLSFKIDKLKQNESKTFTISGKVVPQNELPQEPVCIFNRAIVAFDGKDQTSDNTQFCVQRIGVTPVPPLQVTPPTGPSVLPLLAFGITGAIGFILKRRLPNK